MDQHCARRERGLRLGGGYCDLPHEDQRTERPVLRVDDERSCEEAASQRPVNYDLRSGSLAAPDTVIAVSCLRVSHAVTRVYPHAVPVINAPPVKNSTVSLGYATNANRAPPTATKMSPQKPRTTRALVLAALFLD